MLHQWIKMCVCGALLAGAGWPASSVAAKQDYDLADRIYEKYKEREEKDRGEQPTRSSGRQKNSLSNERDERSETPAQQQKAPSQDSREKRNSRYKRTTVESNSNRRDEHTRSTENRSTENRSGDDRLRSNRSSAPVPEERSVERVSLDQAVNMIRRRTDGKVVGAKTTGSGTRRQHRIKVLINDSRVRTYIVNASTGEIY